MEVNKQQLKIYLDEMRTLLAVTQRVRKEVARLTAPDCHLFNILNFHENHLSKIIGYFLNPVEGHGQGRIFLWQFLDIIENSLDGNTKNKIVEIRRKWRSAESISVTFEELTTSIPSSQRRMDILVTDGVQAVMIENKPWARDQENQLLDYSRELTTRYGEHFLMLYLSSTIGSASTYSIPQQTRQELENDGKLLSITYAEHIVNWLTECIRLSEADRARGLLKDFLSYVTSQFLPEMKGGNMDSIHQEIIHHLQECEHGKDSMKIALQVGQAYEDLRKAIIQEAAEGIIENISHWEEDIQVDIAEWLKEEEWAAITLKKEQWGGVTVRIEACKRKLQGIVIGVYMQESHRDIELVPKIQKALKPEFSYSDEYWVCRKNVDGVYGNIGDNVDVLVEMDREGEMVKYYVEELKYLVRKLDGALI